MAEQSKAAKKAAESRDNGDSQQDNGAAETPSDDAVEQANKPGESPAASIPDPHTVRGLTSAKAGPMQGGDPAERDTYVAEALPVEQVTDRELQTYPAAGYDLSSTDPTYAAAGGRTVAGERFDALVGEDGNAVSADSLFNDEDGKSFVTANERVYEQFYYPNTTEKAKRLLFVPGQRIPRAEAARIKATLS